MAVSIAGSVAGWAFSTFAIEVTTALVIGYVAAAASVIAVGAAVRHFSDDPQADWDALARSRQILANTADAVTPIKVIYGARRIGCTRVFTHVSGFSKEYLNVVLVWGEGRIEAIDQIYFDDVPMTDARFAGLVYREDHLGDPSQPASAALIQQANYTLDDFGNPVFDQERWSLAHRGDGIAYTYLRLTWTIAAWNGLPVFTADIRGKRVYDPRDLSTGYSTNPALCIRDFLTNAVYGRGIAEAEVDDVAFGAAADICDETITVPTPGGTEQIARYACEGVVDIDQSSLDSTLSLLSSCRGFLVWSAGKYKLGIDHTATPSGFVFTTDNIIGQWSIKLPGKRGIFNRCRARFFNPLQEWQADIATYDSPTYRTEDNGLVLDKEEALPFTANYYRALAMAQVTTQVSRAGTVVQFTATQEALRCEVGDVVGITHETPGWTNKLARVIGLEIKPNDEVGVTLQLYDAAAYSTDVAAYVSSLPGTALPDPFNVDAPENVVLESGTNALYIAADGTVKSRIRVTWDLVNDAFVGSGGRIECQFKRTSDSAWQDAASAMGTAEELFVIDVEDGESYDVRIRAVTLLGNTSDWTQAAAHVVVGKTELPSDVAMLTVTGTRLSWTPVADRDLAGYKIKIVSGSAPDWGAGYPMHEGVITESPYDMLVEPNSLAVVMIKAVDTSGHESLNPAWVSRQFVGAPVENEALVFDREADGFPGVKTNCTVSGGDLIADSTTFMWNTNASVNMWSLDTAVLMWATSLYLEMTYEDTVTISDPIEGGRLIVEAAIIGDPWSIEYRESSTEAMWADTAALMWGDSGDAMWATADWISWPGEIALEYMAYDFRFRCGQGTTQGRINTLTFIVDAPTLEEDLDDVAISSGGTRLALASEFRQINAVQLTLQGSGAAVTPKVLDKDEDLGPLVQCFDASGTGVGAVVDANVRGY